MAERTRVGLPDDPEKLFSEDEQRAVRESLSQMFRRRQLAEVESAALALH